jgi:hypothetical protein
MDIPLFATVLLGILGLAVDSERAEREFALLTRHLVAAPSNVSVQNAILAMIWRSKFAHLPEAASQKVYRIALHALAENSRPAAQAFALEIGRWHFGRCRPDKKLTACDEQAIQKDVLARCR